MSERPGRQSMVSSVGVSLLAALAALLSAACAGLPSDLVELAGQVPARIEAEAGRTASSERQYEQFRESADYEAVRTYAESESWPGKFDEARARLRAADAVYVQEIQPYLERNDPSEAEALRGVLAKIDPLLAASREASGHWTGRRDFLLEVGRDPQGAMQGCTDALARIRQARPELESRLASAKRDHEARADEIDGLASPLSALVAETQAAVDAAASQMGTLESGGEANLAILGDSCRRAGENRDTFLAGMSDLIARLAELDRSYSRTLIDMRADYSLLVRRQSWDDQFDYPALHDQDYRVGPIDAGVFEALVTAPGSIATVGNSWTGPRVRLQSGVTREHWDALGIDPFARWPRGDTSGELWVESADVKYFHKYLAQEGGETSESGWTPVSEELFMANLDNLGMDIESKPYGSFESEKLAHATPPGMAYVGNPRYGRWASDGSGGMFWSWAAQYMFYSTLFGSPMRYGRSEWDSWSRDYRGSRPYYGGTGAAPRWGSRSQTVRTSPTMRGSTFARGGGFRQPPASVRRAGSLSRSGAFGPSGK